MPGSESDSLGLTPERRWERTIAAIDASEDPDRLEQPGRILLHFWEVGDPWRSRLTELTKRDPKVATALQAAALLREQLIADIVGWDHLASTWCRFYDRGDPWDRWAEQVVMPLIVGRRALSVENAWQLVLRLLAAAPSEKVLGNIGASPLEDLLSTAPDLVAELIERETETNDRLRQALAHVWQLKTPDDVFQQVKRLVDRPE